MKIFIFLFFLTALISACNKSKPCASPDPYLVLRIYNSNNVDLLSPKMLGSFKDSVAIYYSNGHGGMDTLPVSIEPKSTGYDLVSTTMGSLSVSGIKTFYLRRARTITDTIYADFSFKTDGSCKYMVENEVKFNGVVLKSITESDDYYLLAISNR